jgi:hypothetical protein
MVMELFGVNFIVLVTHLVAVMMYDLGTFVSNAKAWPWQI